MKAIPLAILGAALLSACNREEPAAGKVELAISCGAAGQEFALCQNGVGEWSRKTGHKVRVVSTPNSPSERLALYQQLLAAKADDVDVFQIDVVWTSMLAAHFIDLAPFSGSQPSQLFPVTVRNNTVDGRLVAMPWYVETAMLYYRRDLLDRYGLPIPRTWDELEAAALRVQASERARGSNNFWGYAFQGKNYEGLTCVAVELTAAAGSGTFVDDAGRITASDPRNAMAIARATGWIGKISPPGTLNYSEEESRGLFQAGNALFMRNWPYAWALASSDDSPIKGKVGVAPLPGFTGTAGGTLGGWQLAVSRYSKHPDLAADLVLYLTSRTEQRRRAIVGGYNPTWPALYRDPEILKANPHMRELAFMLERAVSRPARQTGYRFSRVSAAISSSVHDSLSGRETPRKAMEALDTRLAKIRRRGWQ